MQDATHSSAWFHSVSELPFVVSGVQFLWSETAHTAWTKVPQNSCVLP